MTGLATAELVPEEALMEFVRRQRWFGAKSAELVAARVVDAVALREEGPMLLETIAEVRYGSGAHDIYQLVLGLTEDGEPETAIEATDGGTVYEALGDPYFTRELFHLLRAGSVLPSADGAFEFSALGQLTAEPPAFDAVRPLGLEQTNSSVVVNDELIVKAYRHLEAGVNPELELLRFFATHGYDNVPRLAGWWAYNGALMSASLGIVQKFVPGAVDGWTLALEEIPAHPAEFVARVDRLGTVLGEMHSVLGSDSGDPVFAPEEASRESLPLLIATVDDEIDEVFSNLPEGVEALRPIERCGDALRDLLRSVSTVGSIGKRIRHHGDLHLGQALWANGDWLIIDFEGEPARPLPERRLKASPLRDVAGILRSFTYAVSVTGAADPTIEEEARKRFLDAYFEATRASGILPPRETATRLLGIFELEKAVYELRYELNNRPEWVSIPVAGISRLLEEGLG